MTVEIPGTAPGMSPGDHFLTACPVCGAAVLQMNLDPHLSWHSRTRTV